MTKARALYHSGRITRSMRRQHTRIRTRTRPRSRGGGEKVPQILTCRPRSARLTAEVKHATSDQTRGLDYQLGPKRRRVMKGVSFCRISFLGVFRWSDRVKIVRMIPRWQTIYTVALFNGQNTGEMHCSNCPSRQCDVTWYFASSSVAARVVSSRSLNTLTQHEAIFH